MALAQGLVFFFKIDGCLPICCQSQFGRILATFRKHFLPPLSGRFYIIAVKMNRRELVPGYSARQPTSYTRRCENVWKFCGIYFKGTYGKYFRASRYRMSGIMVKTAAARRVCSFRREPWYYRPFTVVQCLCSTKYRRELSPSEVTYLQLYDG